MLKLKSILNEAYAWEREAGKPLPTLADTTAAYAAKIAEQSAMQPISNPMASKLDPQDVQESMHDFDDEKFSDAMRHAMIVSGSNPDRDDSQRDEVFDIIMTYTKDPDVAEAAYAAWESGADMSPELEANVTRDPRWKYVRSPQREAARPDFLDLDGDGDEQESMKSAAASKASQSESFNRRLMGNLKGSEFILSETFRK